MSVSGKTILQIIPDLDAGGAERTTIDIAAALAEAGARPLVASRGGRLVGELQMAGGVWLDFPAATKNPALMAANVIRLARLMRAQRVDLVHARSRAPAWVALAAARLCRTPLVTTWHGDYSGGNTLKNFYNSVMARADAVIANSRYTAARIEALHPWAKPRITVIERGTDMRAFSPQAVAASRVQKLRAAWGVPPGAPIVLLAARLTPWKGQRVLIDATKVLVEKGFSDVHVILAGATQGRDAYRRDLETRIGAAGLGGRVRLVGHCDDMPAALLAASVVAVPSIEPEAFGRVAVEAQAMGALVVATDLGAVPETICAPPDVDARQRTGWRIAADDAPALADALAAALALGASAREAMAGRARAHVEKRFSVETMRRETLAVYARLLAGRDKQRS